MSKRDLWRDSDHAEQRSAQLRQRFAMTSESEGAQRVRDWMTGAGAVPVTLLVAAVVVYAVAMLILAGR